jgi:HlyD family secretion protein
MKALIAKIKGSKVLTGVAVGVIALIVIFCVHALYKAHEARIAAKTLTLNGNVDLREVSLAFKNSDRIDEILVEEGDTIKKGQVLARLDTQDLKYKIKITESQIAAQQAAVDKLHNGTRQEDLAQAAAKYNAATAERDFLQREYDRKANAFSSSNGKSVSREALDDARSKLDVAVAKAKEAEEANNLAIAGPRAEDVAAGEAKLESLKNELNQENYTLSQSELIAPSDGVIRSRLLEPGDMASPQKPVFRISLNTKKWVRVYVKETDLGKLHEGSEASVYIDSYPNKAISGQVGYISSTAEFTPKNVETSDLRPALLYEVRVYVDDPDNLLRMGMPATVKVSL